MGYIRAYSVEPVKAQWSGKARPDLGISQVITCNFDSLKEVHFFAGERGNGGSYTATVLPEEGGNPIATSEPVTQGQNHSWVIFSEWTLTGDFVKGKRYEFRFTRSGSDSIQFYYDPNNPYHYGQIEIGGGGFQPPPQPVEYCDLCLRCYGVMRPENLGACKTPATA